MFELMIKVLQGQYEAALCMLNDCVATCSPAQWDGSVGKYPFWQVAYHTLCFVDLYLSPDEKVFHLRPDLHPAGWRELDDEYPSRQFEKAEIAAYIDICRRKAGEALAAETAASLAGPSGHSRRHFSRCELHVYSIRHIQHHVGQLSAFLRRSDPALQSLEVMRWVGTGWTSE